MMLGSSAQDKSSIFGDRKRTRVRARPWLSGQAARWPAPPYLAFISNEHAWACARDINVPR
eukprot:4244780-Pleurochrysis_carterae.AAC.1